MTAAQRPIDNLHRLVNSSLSVHKGARQALPGRQEGLALTQNQFLVWAGQALHPDTPLYNVAYAFILAASVDLQAFGRAFDALIGASDALRTVIQETGGIPRQFLVAERAATGHENQAAGGDHASFTGQYVLAGQSHPLAYLDFSQRPQPEAAFRDWAEKRCRQTRFNLAERLWDSALVKLAEGRFGWYLCVHHLVTDGWSHLLALRYLAEFYELALRGRLSAAATSPLPPYRDYVLHEHAYSHSEQFRRAESYWRRKLADPIEPLLFYGRRVPAKTGPTERLSIDLGVQRSERLRALARRPDFFVKNENVTLSNLFTALFAAYVQRVSGAGRLSIGTPFHNRSSQAFQETIGLFMEPLPLHVVVDGQDTLPSLVGQVAAEVRTTLQHRPYAVRNPEDRPAYELSVNYFKTNRSRFGGQPVTVHRIAPAQGQDSLALQVHDFGAQGSFTLDFDLHCHVFAEEQRRQVPAHFLQLMDSLLADWRQPLGRAALLPPAERERLLHWRNQERVALPPAQTVVELFEAQVQRRPQQAAIVHGSRSVTYATLNAQANQLARHLRALGVGPESLVGLCVERSPPMIVGLLGVLKAGGAYVPLDIDYPAERLAFMLADAQVSVVITQEEWLARLPSHQAPVVCLDRDWPAIARNSSDDQAGRAGRRNLAYMIYTSGSSGRPKGVMVEHGSLLNFVAAAGAAYPILSQDRLLQFASSSWDTSAEEIYGALTQGATLVLRTPAMLASAGAFWEACRSLGVTALNLPTAFWHALVGETTALPRLRQVIIGGERAQAGQVAAWQRIAGRDVQLLNTYGATETTAVTTWYDLTGWAGEAGAPIGYPLGNVQAYVLDDWLEPAPVGTPGWLCVGGAGLSRGYWGQPALTAQRFMPNPFSAAAGERLYWTGDRARRLADGSLEFLGRGDRQVKVRGFRIELAEVEAALAEHEAVREVAVLAHEDGDGGQQLTAYVVGGPERPPSGRELRRFLLQRLPQHMAPAAFVPLPALPLTPGGKVDYQALLAPAGAAPGDESETYLAPRDEVERQLVQIWQALLGVGAIGVEANFFELGGNSLLAMRLFAQMEATFGRRTPLATLFQSPTVAQLAAVIRQGEPVAGSVLVSIQPGAARPPFFCVHGFGGGVIGYVELARLMGADQPFYGLQARGLEGDAEPHERIDEMAAHYVAAVRAAQPVGPYHLGGYCFGGVVAYEMARQLQAQGEQVALLAILDGYAPAQPGGLRAIRTPRHLANFLGNFPYWLRDYLRLGGGRMLARIRRQARLAWKKAGRRRGASVTIGLGDVLDDIAHIPPERRRLMEAQVRASSSYEPAPYAGQITLFRVRRLSLLRAHDPAMGWGNLTTGGVQVIVIPGGHNDLLEPPHVQALAGRLRGMLD